MDPDLINCVIFCIHEYKKNPAMPSSGELVHGSKKPSISIAIHETQEKSLGKIIQLFKRFFLQKPKCLIV